MKSSLRGTNFFQNSKNQGVTNTPPSSIGPGSSNPPTTKTHRTGTPPSSTETDDDDKLTDATKKCIKAGGYRFRQATNNLQASFGDLSCGETAINDLINNAVFNLIEAGDCGNLDMFNNGIINSLIECLENTLVDFLDYIDSTYF